MHALEISVQDQHGILQQHALILFCLELLPHFGILQMADKAEKQTNLL